MIITPRPILRSAQFPGRQWRPGLLVLSLVAMLSGCSDDKKHGKTSSEPEDALPEGSVFGGRVIDGYLRNAFVWIDLNANDTHDANEPSTETGKFGRFSFTAEQLAGLDNPAAYPLLAFIEAGKVVDEDLIPFNAAEPIAEAPGLILRSYMLKAPAGVQLITPFSTLTAAYIARQVETNAADPAFVAPDFRVASTAVSTLLGLNTNMLRDYVAESERRLHAYAKSITRALQAETEKQVELIGNTTPGRRELIDALSADTVRASHFALLDDIPLWLPVARAYADTIKSPGNLLGLPLRRIERHMRLALGVDNPLGISSIQWFAGDMARSDSRRDADGGSLESNEVDLTSIASGGVDVLAACEDSSNMSCTKFAETTFTYGVFGRVLQQNVSGTIEMQLAPHPIFGFQPLTTFRPESTELSTLPAEPEIISTSFIVPKPKVISRVPGSQASSNTKALADRILSGYIDLGRRATDGDDWELRIGSAGDSCVAYAGYTLPTAGSGRDSNDVTSGCLDYLWRFSFDDAGRITDESVVQLSPFKIYRISRSYEPVEGDTPLALKLMNISMQTDTSQSIADPAAREALLGGEASLETPLPKLVAFPVSARKIEAAIPAEERPGSAARFQRIVEDPTLDVESIQAGLSQLAPQFNDLFGFNPLGIVFNDSEQACGSSPAGAQAIAPVDLASFKYTGDQLTSVCRPNLGCPVKVDDSALTASWCWHLEYEGSKPAAAYLEQIPANGTAQGPSSQNIVMLQRFQYKPLIELLDVSAKSE